MKREFGIITERICRRQICTAAPMLAECECKKLGKKKSETNELENEGNIWSPEKRIEHSFMIV